MIYLDHAATTPVKPEVFEAMKPFFMQHYGNPSSLYRIGRMNRQTVDRARKQLSDLISAQPGEIYFTSGGSEADNWALWGTMRSAKPGRKHIITTKIEHHAILNACKALEKAGYSVTYLDVDHHGVVDPESVRQAITGQTALISVMLANNEVGVIQPISQIAAIAHEYGIRIHCDAVQAVGHIPVNVHDLHVDLLSISGHKFYGPKGIGALYVRQGCRIDPLIYGGAQEQGMRAGTENMASIVGIGQAAMIAQSNLDSHKKRITALRDHMIELAVRHIPGIQINGLGAERLPGHVHMTINHADTSLLLMQLDFAGIAASSGSACASGAIERSHVLRAMGIVGEHQADLRFTLGESNTIEEIEHTIDVLAHVINR